MTQVDFGPVNITYGNIAEFVAQLFDSNHNMISPASATLTLTYLNINNAIQTDNITLLPSGGNLTGTWSSTNAAPGIIPWTVTAAGLSSIAQTGDIRVIQLEGAFGAPLVFAPLTLSTPTPQLIITVGGTYSAAGVGDILINTTALVTLNLPNSLTRGSPVGISDISGNPNVLIVPFPGQTVLGLPVLPLTGAMGGFTLWPEAPPLTGGWYIK
jgi:hypothetical protein